jgi:predicted dehydrogenase
MMTQAKKLAEAGEGRLPLRFAVIGCGAVAQAQHLPNIASSPRMELHTCVDLNDAVLAECRERYGALHTRRSWEDAVEDPDVDVICLATTEKMRLPVSEAAARQGKPVYVEKPMATTIAEMRRIREVVKAAAIAFCVGHNRRASPAMLAAHRMFRRHMDDPQPNPWRWQREPDLPQLEAEGVPSVSVRINDDWHSWKGWVFDPEQAPHGPLLFEMTHFTDVCNWFVADQPVEVTAVAPSMLNESVIMRYSSGALATIVLANNGTFGYGKELYEFMGNGAYVGIDHLVEVRTAGIEGAPSRLTFPMLGDRHPEIGTEGGISGWLAKKRAACDEAAAAGDPMLQFTAEPDKGHAHALERFVDEILGIGPEVCGVDAAVLATEAAFAAVRSAKERRPVKLSEIETGSPDSRSS